MSVIATPIVAIRPLAEADITPAYVGWMNDPEVTRYLLAGRTPQTVETIRAFVATVAQPFAVEADRQMVGTICLRTVDAISRVAEVGILIGDRQVWRQGIALAALNGLEAHAREQGLCKLWAGTCNPAAARLFEKAGWICEGVQVAHVYLDGVWRDHSLWRRSP